MFLWALPDPERLGVVAASAIAEQKTGGNMGVAPRHFRFGFLP
jgi:hypothetical protein